MYSNTSTPTSSHLSSASPSISKNNNNMNVISAIQEYIKRMLNNIQGMKVLILDKETAGIISMVYSQSEILQKEVFLFEMIDNKSSEKMLHMKGVFFIRPSRDNIDTIVDQLKDPKYSKYHIFFTNTLDKDFKSRNYRFLDDIARADEQDAVAEVQEFFGDYFAINPDTYSLNIPHVLTQNSGNWNNNIQRIIDGLFASLVSLKKKPTIRFTQKSKATAYLADMIQQRMANERDLFDFKRSESLLLILDRRDDPITPLLHQWTYQAMIHDLLGITNNRVVLPNPSKPELKEVVLSLEHDIFYKDNLYKNFGDLGASIKELVDQFQDKMSTNANIQTIDDMKKFIENYPSFQKFSTTVSKHVSLMDELSNIVSTENLMDLSEIQQELSCNHEHSSILPRIVEILRDDKYHKDEKKVILLLYSIRYEDKYESELVPTLLKYGINIREYDASVKALHSYAGSHLREGDLLGTKNIFSFAKSVVKRGFQGVSNIYTQHKPMLNEILDMILKNKLKEQSYPYHTASPSKERPQDIIIFMIGGITYEEALTVYTFNSMNVGVCRVVLGGTTILNTKQFITDVEMRN
eukprot:gene849-1058_t